MRAGATRQIGPQTFTADSAPAAGATTSERRNHIYALPTCRQGKRADCFRVAADSLWPSNYKIATWHASGYTRSRFLGPSELSEKPLRGGVYVNRIPG
jgi:hypothetical protein